jgi:hypothetical protein
MHEERKVAFDHGDLNCRIIEAAIQLHRRLGPVYLDRFPSEL